MISLLWSKFNIQYYFIASLFSTTKTNSIFNCVMKLYGINAYTFFEVSYNVMLNY